MTAARAQIKVAIVEDDPLVRESLGVLVAGASGFLCVGMHQSGEEALRLIPGQAADVVLMAIELPGMSGIECVRALKRLLPNCQIVMLTVCEDGDLVFESLRAGAVGYLLKRTPYAEILAAVRETYLGGSPLTSSIARKVVQFLRQGQAEAAVVSHCELPHLSPRETEVLGYLAKGFQYKEIADSLNINLETVRTHLRRTYGKLHVRSRTEAVVRFLQT